MSEHYPIAIQHFVESFSKSREQAVAFISSLDEDLFITKPNADRWSIAECYSHLVETGNLYLAKVDEGMSKIESENVKPENPIRLRLHMKWFVQYLEPPVSMKSKAPGAFQPVADTALNKDNVLKEFSHQMDGFLSHLSRAQKEHLDLSSIKVSNPLISIVGMTLAECIAVTEAHTRRHIQQAERVLKQLQ